MAAPNIQRKKKQKQFFLLALVLALLTLALSAFVIFTFFRYEILPFKFRFVITLLLVFSNIYLIILLISGIKKPKLRLLGLGVSVLVLVCVIAFSVYLQRGINTLNAVSEKAEQVETQRFSVMSLRVLKNSPIQSIEQLKEKKILTAYSSDKVNIDKYYGDFYQKNQLALSFEDSPSYLSALRMLYDGKADAILFNEDFLPLIKEQFPQFEQQTRSLSSVSVQSTEVLKGNRVDLTEDAFNVYISGIDTDGAIENSARSDVNIIMSVNPKDKTILLTSIPRDTYLPIAGGGDGQYDKLTHAGLYGTQASVETLENFLGIRINYYMRVNFTSTINLIDMLGGIEIDNPYEFSLSWMDVTYPVGWQTLNGEKALAYARERYNLDGGDEDRGRNQERILAAVIRKLSSTETLKNFSGVLDLARASMQTNLSTSDMMKLVNMQLESPGEWKILNATLNGDGQYGLLSYAMPGYEVYVMIPDSESVASIKKQINDVLLGDSTKPTPSPAPSPTPTAETVKTP